MRPYSVKQCDNISTSFTVRNDKVPQLHGQPHFHTEMELIFFRSGSGFQCIGDNFGTFKTGDMVLVGENLPHYWVYNISMKPRTPGTEALVIHFSKEFLGIDFLMLPEVTPIRTLLANASHGLAIKGDSKKEIADLMDKLLTASGISGIVIMLSILEKLATRATCSPIASVGYNFHATNGKAGPLLNVYSYVHTNFYRRISLAEIANVANVSHNSFCRFFKQQTGKTFVRFLLELRVAHACKLLFQTQENLKTISRKSGFNNDASFFKYFKLITGKTPIQYQHALFRKNSIRHFLK
jgi:AraC-like DNA-binding protein